MSLKWHRACTVLGLSGVKKSAGWPQDFDLESIAKLQCPQSDQDMRTVLEAMKADCANGSLNHSTITERRHPPTSNMSRLDLMRMSLIDNAYEVMVYNVNAADLAAWFVAQSEPLSTHLVAWFEVVNAQGAKGVVVDGKQRRQERRILELLIGQGFIPKSLPIRSPGSDGVKVEIKQVALLEKSLFSKRSFEHAWDRLRSFGDVAGG